MSEQSQPTAYLRSPPLGALSGVSNRPHPAQEPREAELRAGLKEDIADYLAAVRDAERHPAHLFIEGFFTELAHSAAALAEPIDATAWAPVAPLSQDADLLWQPRRRVSRPRVAPDPGRRVQLWWEELARGSPPLRADEAVRFLRRGEWLGRVESVAGERFVATVWDRSAPATPERAEFLVARLSRRDAGRLCEGAFFYWSVGYLENAAGDRIAASALLLRRTPAAA